MNKKNSMIRLLKKVPLVTMPRPRCELDSCGCQRSSFTWVSHKYQYVWFETPKCASSSLKSMLPDATLSVLPSRFRHRSDYVRFGVVRNPWAKMVSNYSMFVRKEDTFRNGQIEKLFGISREGLSFERFLELAEQIPNHHWAECHDFFPKREDGVVDLDAVVRFENFSREIQEVGDRLGVDFDIEHENRTDHRPYREYYTPATREQVHRMFRRDIKLFGYRF